MGDSQDEGPNPVLDDLIREVIENQLEQGYPVETRETLERLIKAGYTREQAVDKIAAVAVNEIHDILKSLQPFDLERYVGRLSELK